MNLYKTVLASMFLSVVSAYKQPMPSQFNGVLELAIVRSQFEELMPNPEPEPEPKPKPSPEICETCDNTGYIYIEADGRTRKVQCTNPDCPYWRTHPAPEPEPSPISLPEVTIDSKDYNYVYVNGTRIKRNPPPLINKNFVSAKWIGYDLWQECYGDHCRIFPIKTDKKINLGLDPESYKSVLNR